jgi:hypothetical protein
MKKLLIVVALLACAGCEKQISFTGLTDNRFFGARVGYQAKDSQIETGIQSYWFLDNPQPQVWGAYVQYHFPQDVNIPNPISESIIPLPNFKANMLVGGQISIDTKETDQSFGGPEAGIIFQDIFEVLFQYRIAEGNVSNDIENQFDRFRVLFAPVIRF